MSEKQIPVEVAQQEAIKIIAAQQIKKQQETS